MSKIQNISWALIICFISLLGVIAFSILKMLFPVLLLVLIAGGTVIINIIRSSKEAIKHEEELNQMKLVLEKKERIIADFSHKIRTPLNNFSIIIDLIQETNPGKQQKELLETLIASTSNMITVLNDLAVDTAREVSFEPRRSINFNLTETLKNTVELFVLKPENRLNIKITPSPDFQAQLYGDPISVKQIFLDIFNEIVIKESENLEIDISISSKISSKAGYIVSFSIVSNKAIKFFEYNPDDNYPSDSLAVKLILLMGGKISLSSTGSSSTLLFSIPFSKPFEELKMSDAALRIKELKSENRVKKVLSDINILLVEDNPTNQKIVQISLASKVKNIDVASNGKEALDLFGTSNYDLILMDVQLPIMDGIRAVEKIRELEASTSKHTPIIAVTANAMLGDKEKCLSAGMDEYLSKPFQPSQLISLIEKLISR